MDAKNTASTRNERKIRKKKLLRAYREDQKGIIWNQVVDEAGFCDLKVLDAECDSHDFPNPQSDPELQGCDEDYPNKAETLHNMFPCD